MAVNFFDNGINSNYKCYWNCFLNCEYLIKIITMGISNSRDSSQIMRVNESGIRESIGEDNELSDVADLLNYLILRLVLH